MDKSKPNNILGGADHPRVNDEDGERWSDHLLKPVISHAMASAIIISAVRMK